MPGPAVLVSAPFALGGDALAGNNAAIAAVALGSMVIGYLLLAGLWYFVFRRSPAEREAERRDSAMRERLVGEWRPAGGSTGDSAPEHPARPPVPGRMHASPLHIERPRGPRFRRR